MVKKQRSLNQSSRFKNPEAIALVGEISLCRDSDRCIFVVGRLTAVSGSPPKKGADAGTCGRLERTPTLEGM